MGLLEYIFIAWISIIFILTFLPFCILVCVGGSVSLPSMCFIVVVELIEMLIIFKPRNKRYNKEKKDYTIPIIITIILLIPSAIITFSVLTNISRMNPEFGFIFIVPTAISSLACLIITLIDISMLSKEREQKENDSSNIQQNIQSAENLSSLPNKDIITSTISNYNLKENSKINIELPTIKSNEENKPLIEEKEKKLCSKCGTGNGLEAKFCFICNHQFK